MDPLVDGLRSREAELLLQLPYGETGFDTHPVDVLTGRDSVDVRKSHHTAPPVRQHNRHREGWLRRLIQFRFSGLRQAVLPLRGAGSHNRDLQKSFS